MCSTPASVWQIEAGEQPRLLSVVRGSVAASHSGVRRVLERGANVLVPYAAAASFAAEGAAIVLVTEKFV